MDAAFLLAVCTAAHTGALMAWFGALSLERVLPEATGAGLWPAARSAAWLALAGALAWPLLQTAIAFDDPRAAFDPRQIEQVVLQTSFGRIWAARLAVVALAVLADLALRRNPGVDSPLFLPLYVFVAIALASLGLVGHAAAAAGGGGVAQRLIVALHLLAAGAWLGALPVLWVLAGRLEPPELASALARFSRYGVVLVAIVLATGAASAAFRLGRVDALFDTGYGRILAAKLALVAAMGGCALVNRNRLAPALMRPDIQARAAARAGLRRTIALEAAVGFLVVVAAVALGSSEAPA